MHSGVSFIILQMDSSADAGNAAVPCASRDGRPFGGISGESSLLVKYTLLSLLPIKHRQQKQMRTPVRDRLAELALLLHRRGQPTVITGWPSCHPRRLGLPGPLVCPRSPSQSPELRTQGQTCSAAAPPPESPTSQPRLLVCSLECPIPSLERCPSRSA